jgi:hypothetical protein
LGVDNHPVHTVPRIPIHVLDVARRFARATTLAADKSRETRQSYYRTQQNTIPPETGAKKPQNLTF